MPRSVPVEGREIGEASATDRLGVRAAEEEVEDEEDVASIGLTLGSPPALSDAELALSLGPVRPSSNLGETPSFRQFL